MEGGEAASALSQLKEFGLLRRGRGAGAAPVTGNPGWRSQELLPRGAPRGRSWVLRLEAGSVHSGMRPALKTWRGSSSLL